MAQLIPLPLAVSCFSKIQLGFIFLVPAHPGSPGKGAVKRVCVCVWLFLLIILDLIVLTDLPGTYQVVALESSFPSVTEGRASEVIIFVWVLLQQSCPDIIFWYYLVVFAVAVSRKPFQKISLMNWSIFLVLWCYWLSHWKDVQPVKSCISCTTVFSVGADGVQTSTWLPADLCVSEWVCVCVMWSIDRSVKRVADKSYDWRIDDAGETEVEHTPAFQRPHPTDHRRVCRTGVLRLSHRRGRVLASCNAEWC